MDRILGGDQSYDDKSGNERKHNQGNLRASGNTWLRRAGIFVFYHGCSDAQQHPKDSSSAVFRVSVSTIQEEINLIAGRFGSLFEVQYGNRRNFHKNLPQLPTVRQRDESNKKTSLCDAVRLSLEGNRKNIDLQFLQRKPWCGTHFFRMESSLQKESIP